MSGRVTVEVAARVKAGSAPGPDYATAFSWFVIGVCSPRGLGLTRRVAHTLWLALELGDVRAVARALHIQTHAVYASLTVVRHRLNLPLWDLPALRDALSDYRGTATALAQGYQRRGQPPPAA